MNLSKNFGSIKAVDNLNLEIQKGKFLSVVGPSGCGKTTTLRMIAGFTIPDSGRIYINNEIVNDIPPRKRNIGIVFQNYALFPNLNVYENIAFGLKARKRDLKKIDITVTKFLEITGLAQLRNHLPSQISGGQQQRVALARALAIEPRVLLLDEPLSALDAKVRMEMRYEIKRIQRDLSITAVYVTHDQEEALSISDFVAVMNDGKIQQFGTPQDIYNKPINLFVADFIGISNIFECSILSAKEGILLFANSRIKLSEAIAGKEDDHIILSLRPENIHISSLKKEKETSINSFKGEINGITFLGPIARIRVNVAGKNFFVDLPNSPGFKYRTGNQVIISFEEDACKILK